MKRRYVLPFTILIVAILVIGALATFTGGNASSTFTIFKPFIPTRTPTSPADAMLRQVFQMHPAIKHIDDSNAGQTLTLSYSSNGYTITVHRVYADANQTVVAYTVDGVMSKYLLNYTRLHLAEDANVDFNYEVALRSDDNSQVSGHVVSFYTPLSDTLRTKLNLHLSVSLRNKDDYRDIAGPFDFEFSTAVQSKGTIISEVSQTTEGAGIAITLEKVIVTPGATRAVLLFERIDAFHFLTGYLKPKAVLVVDDWTSKPERYPSEASNYIQLPGNRGWAYAYRFEQTPQSWKGAWTLTVTELFDDFVGGRMPFPSISGPWVFKFNMPHAQE